MSFISLKLVISAILFVFSSQILYAKKFRANRVLRIVAGGIALVASVFLSIEVVNMIAGEDDSVQPLPPSFAKLSIQERNAEMVEGDFGTTAFTFLVTRRGNLNGKVSVRYAVFGGAVDSDDFGGRMPSGEIIFRDGQEQSLIETLVYGDQDEEPDEYFTVRLFNPIPDNTVIVSQTAQGIIRNDDRPAPQTSSPAQDDKESPITPSSDPGNARSRDGSRPVYKVVSLEDVEDSEKSEVPFPSAYFRSRLAQELGTSSTTISRIRVGVIFIEPYESRRQAVGGTIIGYILVSLPSLTNCTRNFGSQAYSFSNATTGIMKAINDYIFDIADWIRRASRGEKLTCPTD